MRNLTAPPPPHPRTWPSLQVIILDAHPPGPLDILWPVAAAGGGPAALALARQLESRGLHPWGARVPTGDSGTGSRLLVRRVEDLQARLQGRAGAGCTS